MSLYDDNPLLLARPRPFWEEEEEPIVPPVVVPPPVAPPAAPPPEVEGPGYASLEAIPVAKEAPAPEVVGPGYASLEEIPKEQPPPEVEGPGFASLDEIPGAEPEESFLGKAAKFGQATAKLMLPGLGQAAAVLDPDTQKKAIQIADKTKNSLRSGWLSGDVAMELQKPNPNLDYVAQQQKLIDSLKPDQDFQTAWDDKASAKDSWNAFAKDPLGNIGQLFGQSMGAMVRSAKDYAYKIPERTLQGGILGTGVGAWFGGAGALPGAALGMRGGLTQGMAEMNSMASYANEYAGSVISSLGEAGVDVKNAEQLKAAFSNPELMAGIKAKAVKKGVPVALFDGLSGAVNGNLFAAPGKTLGKKAWEWGAELLVDAAFGGTGEAAGQLASEGKITSPRSIAAEVLMEPVQAVPQVAVNRAMAGLDILTQPLPATPQAVVPPGLAVPPPIPPTPPEAFAPPAPGVTITPAPGEVPVPADLAGAPAVPPPGAPPVVPAGDERFAPPLAAPPAPEVPSPVEPGPRTPEGDAVTQQVGAENLVVKGVADAQAQKLEASNAPETAKAIQQVAARSNTGATVSAAEFLAQAKAQLADQAAAAAEAAAKAAPAAEAPAAALGAVQPGEFAQPGYTAAAPAPAPEASTQAAQPTETAPPAAVVVGGQVFTGATHEEAARAAHAAVGTDAMASASGGWVDETGRFISHDIYEAHQDLNTAIEQSGGNMEAPAVAEAQAQLAEAVARDDELNAQIVQPGGEQVVNTGIKGQEALVAVRPSQELAVPLAGVNVSVKGVTPEGVETVAQRPAAQALNDARNDKTALTILLDCLT